jgi:Family of unknown function (DUF6152)
MEDDVKINVTNNLFIVMAMAAGLLVTSGPVFAHHGVANLYDMSKVTILKGTITKFVWSNPHNQIFFDVTDEKGTVVPWVVATEPPQVMLERGWTRKSLKPGDQVTVYVFPAKNGAPVGNVQKIVLPDGKEMIAGAAPPAATPANR